MYLNFGQWKDEGRKINGRRMEGCKNLLERFVRREIASIKKVDEGFSRNRCLRFVRVRKSCRLRREL